MEGLVEFLTIYNGSGYGSGYSDGSGFGYGSGSGIKSINGQKVSMIDGVRTIISHIKGNLGKGYILQNDLTLTPCYVAKGQNMFAHGKTLREAVADLQNKIFSQLNVDEKIEEFKKKFKKDILYLAQEFYDWHALLTGSCTQGRDVFVRDHNIKLTDKLTVHDFIELCKDSYGGEIIRRINYDD